MSNFNSIIENLLQDKLTRFLLTVCGVVVGLAVGYPILEFLYEVSYDLGQSIGYWLF